MLWMGCPRYSHGQYREPQVVAILKPKISPLQPLQASFPSPQGPIQTASLLEVCSREDPVMGGAVGHSLFHMPWSSQGPLLSPSIHPEGAGPSPVWYLSACSGPSLTVKQQDREAESTGVGKVKDAWENKGKRQRALLRECWGSGGGRLL